MSQVHSLLTVFATAIATVLLGSMTASANLEEVRHELLSRPVPWSENSIAGPLCGVRSAVTAMAILGTKSDISDYVSTNFVPSSKGSSSREIEAIFRQHDIECSTVGGFSALDLYWIDGAIVANVRANPASPAFDHWVTVNWQGNSLMIYDGEGRGRCIRTSDFLAIWNGAAVIASPNTSAMSCLLAVRAALMQLCFLLILGVRKTGQILLHNSIGIRAQFVFILLLAGVATSGFFTVIGFENLIAGSRISSAPFKSWNHEKVSLEGLRQVAINGEAILIDARRPSDFLHGSIPGAVNIPVYASVDSIRSWTEPISTDTELVVFCQSSACG